MFVVVRNRPLNFIACCLLNEPDKCWLDRILRGYTLTRVRLGKLRRTTDISNALIVITAALQNQLMLHAASKPLCMHRRTVQPLNNITYHLFIRTTTSSIHTEAILAEVTMSMTKNTMVRGKKGKGWLKIMGNRTAAAAGAAHICSLL